MPEDQQKKRRIYRTPIFTKTYATNFQTFKTKDDVRINLFNEKIITDEEEVCYCDSQVILTYDVAFKLKNKLDEIL